MTPLSKDRNVGEVARNTKWGVAGEFSNEGNGFFFVVVAQNKKKLIDLRNIIILFVVFILDIFFWTF